VSRRSMLVQAVRRNTAKQTAPYIIVIDAHDGRDPIVTWALDHRKPTPAEITTAIEQYKRERAKHEDAAVQDTQHTMKPAQGSGDEETK
jgi:hypothetical protein